MWYFSRWKFYILWSYTENDRTNVLIDPFYYTTA